MLEHRAVVGDRLTVRPRRGRLAGGTPARADHGLDVSAGDGGVHEAARVGIAEGEQRVQDPTVEDCLSRSRDRSEHRHPGELVPERHLHVDNRQQTRLLARDQGLPGPVDESGREPGLDGAGDYRELLYQVRVSSGRRARRSTAAPTTDRGVVVVRLAKISVTR